MSEIYTLVFIYIFYIFYKNVCYFKNQDRCRLKSSNFALRVAGSERRHPLMLPLGFHPVQMHQERAPQPLPTRWTAQLPIRDQGCSLHKSVGS